MEEMKMMLVDDEERFLSTTKKLLSRKGLDVMTAASGAEALEILRTNQVHVVILDVKMPGMDGIETLKQIKVRCPVVEVILLTCHGAVDTAVTGLKAGAFDYLLKPADFDELIAKLEAARKQKNEHEERMREAEARALLRRSGGLHQHE